MLCVSECIRRLIYFSLFKSFQYYDEFRFKYFFSYWVYTISPIWIQHYELINFTLFSSVGMLISLPFLIVTLLVYLLLPELRNLAGKCFMFNVLGLTLSYTIMQIENFMEIAEKPCIFLGYSLYFSMMLNFFWLNVICFNVWRTLR
jgi:G protein-coupled receptor Mth (Methuselah protein)